MRRNLLGLATDERRDLLALLETLTDEQWRARSLCADWSVRQVAAHVVSYDDLTVPQLIPRMARGGFRVTGMNPHRVRDYDTATHADVLAEVRAHTTPRGVTALFGGAIALTDALIHQQDIRRPLGIPREIPAERLVPALDFALRALALPSRRHVRDLRLAATDLNWAHGRGAELTGPAEALLMAIAGRPAALSDLTGPGVAVLAGRLDAPQRR
jgi:uncharacterized protein (TIGR03083 family)